jgi:hypothetical protein
MAGIQVLQSKVLHEESFGCGILVFDEGSAHPQWNTIFLAYQQGCPIIVAPLLGPFVSSVMMQQLLNSVDRRSSFIFPFCCEVYGFFEQS